MIKGTALFYEPVLFYCHIFSSFFTIYEIAFFLYYNDIYMRNMFF